MTLYFCKALISLPFNNCNHFRKPHFYSSITLLFFSSSRRQKSKPVPVSLANYLINQHQFSPETARKASSMINFLKRPEESDSILAFFKENGFSQAHLEKIIKRVPGVLFASLDRTIRPKVKIFQDLGFGPTDIADILSADPWIFNRSADNRLLPSIAALKNVIGSNSDVSKILKVSAWFLKHDLEKTMIPNIEFMKSCGISQSQIMKFIFSFPRLFLHKPESVTDFVRRVDGLGYDRKSKMYLYAIRTISSMTQENWELKLKLFRSLGFSENDILSAFRKAPQVFAVSERKITEVTRFLLSAGKSDITLVVNHPELLSCSLEQRLKPRFRVLKILEGKNLLRRKPSITTICKISNKQFTAKYVLPYLNEVGNLDMDKEGS